MDNQSKQKKEKEEEYWNKIGESPIFQRQMEKDKHSNYFNNQMEDSLSDYKDLLIKDEKIFKADDKSILFNTSDIFSKEVKKNKLENLDLFELKSKNQKNIELLNEREEFNL